MHVQCHDITHDVTAPPDDVTSKNKRHTLDAVCLKRVNMELSKTAAKPKAGTTWITGWSTCCHTLSHVFGCIPVTRAYNHFIYIILQCCAYFFYKSTNLQKRGQGGPCAPPAQSSSTSDSHACTSTAVSCGDPSFCGVECTGEQPLTVALESDCGSSKVRGSSSSMIDSHSHDCHHLHGLASHSVSPCSSPVPLDDGLGLTSPCSSMSMGSSSSSHSSSSSSTCPSSSSSTCPLSSSSEEESSGQLMRQWAPSLAMWVASWGMHGMKFANATADLSSTQLRSLAMPCVGTHSTSSLVGLYARTLPSKTRAHTAHK